MFDFGQHFRCSVLAAKAPEVMSPTRIVDAVTMDISRSTQDDLDPSKTSWNILLSKPKLIYGAQADDQQCIQRGHFACPISPLLPNCQFRVIDGFGRETKE